MTTYKWSKKPGYFYGMTQKQSDNQFYKAFRELESVCRDLKFEQVASSGRIKFTFRARKDMFKGGYGVHHGGGRIDLAGGPDESSNIGWPISNYRFPVGTIKHEVMHFLGWEHSPDLDCVMHAHGSKTGDLCPHELLWFQKKWKTPLKEFFPWELRTKGREVRALQHQRSVLIPIRDSETDKEDRAAIHNEILKLVIQERILSDEWLDIYNKYSDVPMAGPKRRKK